MNQATLRVMTASTDTVQVPTVPVKMIPYLAIELEGILFAETILGRSAVRPAADAARIAAEFGTV